jgi:hypothetical protein
LEIINMLNRAPVGIQEVATNPMPPIRCLHPNHGVVL